MIVLDTHALLWWMNDSGELSATARKIIDKEEKRGVIGISAISVWEVCLLIASERLVLSVDVDTWLSRVMSVPHVEIIPIDATIAKTSVFLPNWPHKDPADRFVVATAVHTGSPLVTGDEKIRSYKHVRTIW